MTEPTERLFTEEEFLQYSAFRKGLYRHNAYRNSVSRYIWQNKWYSWYWLTGWADWIEQEARKEYVPSKPLPEWPPEKLQAIAEEYDRRHPRKARKG